MYVVQYSTIHFLGESGGCWPLADITLESVARVFVNVGLWPVVQVTYFRLFGVSPK